MGKPAEHFEKWVNMEVQGREPNVHQGAANKEVRRTLQSLRLGNWPINLSATCHRELSQVAGARPPLLPRLVGGRSSSMFPLCKLI
jgi:hypothetical protein